MDFELYIRIPQKMFSFNMAVIGKIRKQSGLLMILIGGALALFILGDLVNSNSVLFGGTSNEVGEINGSKISYTEFETKVQNFLANRFAGRSIDEATRLQVREQVWNQIIRENVLLPQYKDLGLSVSSDELFYIIQNDPNNANLRSYFSNPQTGQIFEQFANPNGSLNSQAVINYLNNILNVAQDTDQGVADARNSWKQLEQGIKQDLLDNKYNNLITKGMYVTSIEAQDDAVEKADRVSFSYIAKLYSTVEDSEVSYTDADISAYYNEHKGDAQFKQDEPVRTAEYIVFDVKASEDDVKNIYAQLNDLKTAFETSTDDTLFVNENGTTPFNIKWVSAGNFPANVDSTIMTAEINQLVGPFRNGERFELVKVTNRKSSADSVKARHILIPIDSTGIDAAKAKADSIKKVIKKQDNFADMATQFSNDPGSKEQGGDLGWFTEGRMVPAFNDACFEGNEGDMPVVETQFGIHIIEILEKTAPKEKVLVAVVDNTIEPSNATYQKVYSQASSFAINNDNAEKFVAEGEALNIQTAPTVRQNDPSMMGMENSRSIVRWVFENEVGSVCSEPFDLQDKFVVALIKESREKGVLPLDVAKPQIIQEVIKEKKAEKIMAEMQNETDLNALASKTGTAVQIANDVTFSSFSIPGIGNEQELLGMAFTLGQGNTSVPVKGTRGVYVIKVNNVVNTDPSNLNTSKIQLEANIAGNSRFASFAALKEMSDITDNRAKFY